MAITRVQKLGSNNGSGISSIQITNSGSATTVGNHVIVAIMGHASDRTVTVADDAGNTYQSDKHGTAGGSGPFITVLSAKQASSLASGAKLTLTFTGGTMNAVQVVAYEYSGLAATSWLDQVNAGTATSNAANSGNVITTTAAELLFGVVGWENSSASSATGWTKVDEFDNVLSTSKSMLTEENIVSATGTYAATATLVSSPLWCAVAVTYKAASGTTVGPVGIASAAAVGTPGVQRLEVPAGITSGSSVGTPGARRPQGPVGITTTAAVGTPAITRQLGPTGITSAAAVGTPSLRRQTAPVGIQSTATVGTLQVRRLIGATGIASGASVGTPAIGTISLPSFVGDVALNDAIEITVELTDATCCTVALSDRRANGIALVDWPGG